MARLPKVSGIEQRPYVPTVTIHYGNWVMLPERALKALGLTTGDRLEVELAAGDIVLRVAGQIASPRRSADGAG